MGSVRHAALHVSLLLVLCSQPTICAAGEPEPGFRPEEFHMLISDSFVVSDGRPVVTGRILLGSVSVGDSVCLISAGSGNHQVTVEGIEMFSKILESAKAGQQIGMQISGIRSNDITRGDELKATCE